MQNELTEKRYFKGIFPEKWLYLAVFLLPTYVFRLTFFGWPANLWEVVVSVGIFSWLLDKKYSKNLRHIWIKYKKYIISIALILSGLTIGTLLSKNYWIGLGIIKGWFVFPLAFIFLIAEILDSAKVKKMFQSFYLSALVVSLGALLSWLVGQITFDGRLEAFFNSPNYLAMYLSPAIIIGIVLFLESKRFYALSLAPILLSFYLTFSFSAWVAVTIALFSILLLRTKITKKQAVVLGSIFLMVVIFLAFEFKIKRFEDGSFFNSRSSFASRIMIWKTAEKLIQDNLLWGIGPGNFQNKYLAYQEFYPPYLEWAVPHPHNLFLAFWLYAGGLGLLSFLFLLGWFFREFFTQQKNALRYMAFGIMLCLLLHGLLDTTYFKNDLAVIFWLAYVGMFQKEKAIKTAQPS